jgi:hypothetical protein
MKPAAQFVRRRQIAQPFVNRGSGFCETTRPQPIDEHARSIASRCWLVDPLDGNWHKCGTRSSVSTFCFIIVKRLG